MIQATSGAGICSHPRSELEACEYKCDPHRRACFRRATPQALSPLSTASTALKDGISEGGILGGSVRGDPVRLSALQHLGRAFALQAT
ncbi:hypothetical protein DAEQUDRAFT_69846 [Daedalea quercina L-15889]|uniref:Uncharacterized protein n=1 Tax=Daedalea quercina L-15889 TaxID=1314783 RepID=A0A165L6H0_9APHY|nr:hypothetical protein DAEQUDRAFT_69846 [Daedalea quercina L-15889]